MSQTDGGALLLIEIAMVIFLAIFLLIVARVVLARRGTWRRAARLPLEECDGEPPKETPS